MVRNQVSIIFDTISTVLTKEMMSSLQRQKQGRNFVLVDNDCKKKPEEIASMFPVKTDFYSFFSRQDLSVIVYFVTFSEQITVTQLQHIWPKFSIQIVSDNVPSTISSYLVISNLPNALRDEKIAEELVSKFTKDFNIIESFPSLVTVNIPNVREAAKVYRFLSALKIQQETTNVATRNEDIPLVRVTNLPKSINEKLLVELFSQKGTITHVDIFKQGGVSKRYYVADVSFERVEMARYAIKTLNYTVVNEKEIRISQYISRETAKEVELNTLVIENLPQYFSSPMLKVLLDQYAPSYMCYMDEIGPKHVRYGIARYTSEDAADHAIAILNNAEVDGRKIKVQRSRRVCITNFAIGTTEANIMELQPNCFDVFVNASREAVKRPTIFVQYINEKEMNDGLQTLNSYYSGKIKVYAFEMKRKRTIASMKAHIIDESDAHRTVAIHGASQDANEEDFVKPCLEFGELDAVQFQPPNCRVVFHTVEAAQNFVKAKRRGWTVNGDKLHVALSV